jgi:hypothetical protein
MNWCPSVRDYVLGSDAGGYIGCPASGKWNDQCDRARRIGLPPSYAGHGRQRGSACCQMQKLPSVGKFHCQSLHGVQSGADGGASNLLPFLRTQKGHCPLLCEVPEHDAECPVPEAEPTQLGRSWHPR